MKIASEGNLSVKEGPLCFKSIDQQYISKLGRKIQFVGSGCVFKALCDKTFFGRLPTAST